MQKPPRVTNTVANQHHVASSIEPAYQITILAILSLALCTWTVLKGLTPGVHLDELYVWLNTYSHGYVRRGLLGTLLSPLLQGKPPAELQHVLFSLHIATLGVLALLIYLNVRAGQGLAGRRVRLVTALLLATSPFLGQLAHHAGYPDVLIAILLCLSAAYLPRANGPMLAATLIACCMVHELCFLLVLPMAAFSLAMRPDATRRHAAWLAAGAGAAGTLTLAAHPPGQALVDALVTAGLSPDTARDQIAQSIARPVREWLAIMRGLWLDHTAHAIVGLIYAGLPAVLILLLTYPRAARAIATRTTSRGFRQILLVLFGASGLAAFAVLSIALDLSRIASFTTLTAFLTVAQVTWPASNFGPRPIFTAGAAAAILVYSAMPIFDLHFPAGRVVNLKLVGSVCAPCAAAGRAALDWYDRDVPIATLRELKQDPSLGN